VLHLVIICNTCTNYELYHRAQHRNWNTLSNFVFDTFQCLGAKSVARVHEQTGDAGTEPDLRHPGRLVLEPPAVLPCPRIRSPRPENKVGVALDKIDVPCFGVKKPFCSKNFATVHWELGKLGGFVNKYKHSVCHTIGRSHSQNSFNQSQSFIESVTFDESLFMSKWARLGRFLEIYGPKF
jgi:hypothetical protein